MRWPELCKRLNCTPVYKEIAWDNMIAAVSAGQFDMAADGITISDERAKVVDFSDGYISVDQRILVRKDETRFSTVDALKAGTYKGRHAERHHELRRGRQAGRREPHYRVRYFW